jgi:hypothetical protein
MGFNNFHTMVGMGKSSGLKLTSWTSLTRLQEHPLKQGRYFTVGLHRLDIIKRALDDL